MRKFRLLKTVFVFVVSFSMILGMGAPVFAQKDGMDTSEVYSMEGVSAKAYAVIEASTGRMIYGKNTDMRLPIASTTKIMTAMLTLEQPNLDREFVVDSNAIKVEGTSMGLQEGNIVTLRILASGMLLPSGNDGANAAAVKISGSIPAFAEKMNERAAELGMSNTSFVTPSGLDHDEHFSSAEDMAVLAREAIKNESFAEICKSESIKVSYGSPPYSRRLTNHNRLLKAYDGCIGMKTGFTKKAGRCLVSAAQRNDVTLICVTLNAPNDWSDHQRLLDGGFELVKPVETAVETKGIALDVVGGIESKISAVPARESFLTVAKSDELIEKITAEKFLYAPITKGDIVGEILHLYNDEIVARTPLVAELDIDENLTEEKKGLLRKLWEYIFR